jgi:drug/metabolite transporter (DMT)-like permease
MYLFYLSIILAVLSSLMYHVILKFTPANVNPALSFAVTYAAAAVLCLLLLPLFPLKDGVTSALRRLNWASYALAFALVGLEVGFLLAYRAGWEISIAAIFVNAVVTILLVPVGVSLFTERLSTANVVGILVCVIGLTLVNMSK